MTNNRQELRKLVADIKERILQDNISEEEYVEIEKRLLEAIAILMVDPY